MKQLDVINALARIFSERSVERHAGQRGVLRYDVDGAPVAIVLDVSLSRAILVSPAFDVFAFFGDGFERFGDDGSLARVQRFFDVSPVCLRGEAHRTAKQALSALQTEQCGYLAARAPALRALFAGRRARYASPLAYANAFVEVCLAMLISDLMSVPLRTAMRAMRRRRNLFHYHFHRLRHRAAERALAVLDGAGEAEPARRVFAESMLLMGSAPLIAALCAGLLGAGRGAGARPEHCTPVSLVPRVCLEATDVLGVPFAKGEVCHLAMLPATDEQPGDRLPFGAGPHTCVGKRLSQQILDLGLEIAAEHYPEGFRRTPVPAPDGIFLAFRET